MRPQHITAENAAWTCRSGGRRGSFNEAAAYHCGKLTITAGLHRLLLASMRPQHITAENQPQRAVGTARRSASMRPQHITAENTSLFGGAVGVSPSLQ